MRRSTLHQKEEKEEEERTRGGQRPIVKIFAHIGAMEERLKRELCSTLAQKNVAL